MNLMDLKRGIEKAVAQVTGRFRNSRRRYRRSAEIAQVGTVAANGEVEIGDMIAEGNAEGRVEASITVEEANGCETSWKSSRACSRPRLPFAVSTTDVLKMLVEMEKPIPTATKRKSYSKDLSPVSEAISSKWKPRPMIAEEIQGEALVMFGRQQVRGGLKLRPLKRQGWGDRRSGTGRHRRTHWW